MRCEVFGLSRGNVDAVNVGIGKGWIHAVGIDGLIVAAPCHWAPRVAGLLLVGQLRDLAGAPVEEGNVMTGGLFCLVDKGYCFAVVRPVRALLSDRGGIGEVDRLAAITWYGVEVP